MMSITASEFFDEIKNHQNIDDNFEQPSMIISKLRAYQRQTVKWMIDRENNNDLVKSDCSPFSGGILADESGLGKTLEMLSCIVVNTSPSEFNSKKTEFGNLKVIPDHTSIPMSCKICGQIYNPECVHFKSECVPLQKVPYICAICWNIEVQCKATLIVVTESNLNHWIFEIALHIAKPGLKVYVYNGFQSDGFIQPYLFNDYDIVITSYENLLKELNYGLKNQNSSLRNPKKYNYPQSPLSLIKWWRICMDQGQLVKSKINKAYQSMACLQSVHKWSMTSTLIHKSLYDLYSTFKFLDIVPNYDREQFLGLMKNKTDVIYQWLSKIIWRNSVKDSELILPKLTYEKHWLTFSDNEKYFYQHQHDHYAELFSNTVTRSYENLEISLKNIDKKSMNSLMESLKRVKQACWHPQAIRSALLQAKGTMAMKEIKDVMLEDCLNECHENLHSLLTDINLLAGIHLHRSEPASAVKYYRDVLNLMELYRNMQIETHKYEKLHALYHLTNILAEHSELSQPLVDVDLKNSMELLKKECLGSSEQKIASIRVTVQLRSDQIKKLLNKNQFNYSNWWLDALKLISSPKEFIIKIRTELEDYHVPSDTNIANKLNCINDIHNLLSLWLTDLNTLRTQVMSMLKNFEETPIDSLVELAQECHLLHDCTECVQLKHDSRYLCLICQASSQLKIYESLLFCVSNEQTNMSIDKIPRNDDKISYKSTHEGSSKISQKEFLLLKLYEYGKTKILDSNFFKDASNHLKIFNLMREEFIYLKLLCTYFNDNLCAHYKIVKAKKKLWPCPIFQSVFNENKRSKKKIKYNFILDVEFKMRCQLRSISNLRKRLETKISILHYLHELKNKKNSTEPELCPICILKMNSGWAVIPCGHCVCFKCIVEIGSHSGGFIMCPMCRYDCDINSIYYAINNQEDEMLSTVIKGSFSTKIKNITIKLMELIAQDPKVKVLVFSSCDYELMKLEKALKLNSVKYVLLYSNKKYKQDITTQLMEDALELDSVDHKSQYSNQKYNETLIDFKTNTKLNVLLMTLSQASTQLNLTEATNVLFMEPMINKVDENVAIGQIHRIGQTKPTFVHHFICRNSIEENITNMFPTDQLNQWDDITLSQMLTVFKRNETVAD